MTLDSFDFPEQDEDEDASFVILERAEEQDLEAELLEWEMPKKKEDSEKQDLMLMLGLSLHRLRHSGLCMHV